MVQRGAPQIDVNQHHPAPHPSQAVGDCPTGRGLAFRGLRAGNQQRPRQAVAGGIDQRAAQGVIGFADRRLGIEQFLLWRFGLGLGHYTEQRKHKLALHILGYMYSVVKLALEEDNQHRQYGCAEQCKCYVFHQVGRRWR